MDVHKTACWFGNQYFLGRYRKTREEVDLILVHNDIRVGCGKAQKCIIPNEQPLDAYATIDASLDSPIRFL
jgi:hypothetical protein